MPRWIIALLITAFAVPIFPDEPAFLVIGAVAYPPSKRQPTWIALASEKGELLHIPAGKAIVQLAPGTYRIEHIDFGDDIADGRETIDLNGNRSDRIELRAAAIGYFGLIRLDMRVRVGPGDRYGHEIQVIQSVELDHRARHESPEAFQKYPLEMSNRKPFAKKKPLE